MRKIVILIPVYNDWESLLALLKDINSEIQKINNCKFSCLIVNDASTVKAPNLFKPINLENLTLINMKKNTGHQRCIAFGLRYINLKEKYDHVIIMDGDGEDRPAEIAKLIEKANQNTNLSVVAKRVKRSEGPLFQNLYKLHKFITLIFTGKKINFGNYSCLTKKDVSILVDKESLWSNISGSVKKHISNFSEISSERGLRYFGPSKMSIFKLAVHSFSIIAVFKYIVFLRSTFFLIFLMFSAKYLGSAVIFLQIILILFNILIFLASLKENKKALINSHKNVLTKHNITQ